MKIGTPVRLKGGQDMFKITGEIGDGFVALLYENSFPQPPVVFHVHERHLEEVLPIRPLSFEAQTVLFKQVSDLKYSKNIPEHVFATIDTLHFVAHQLYKCVSNLAQRRDLAYWYNDNCIRALGEIEATLRKHYEAERNRG